MLYIVGTPIGTLSEVTHRAIEVLNSVDYIACEDTRTSSIFLKHYGISKPLVSYHKYNEKTMQNKLITDLKAGKDIALISDAGMPVVSDPGEILVNKLKENNIQYTVISGPSAFLNAFILSGFPTPFTFIGFLPDKKADRSKVLTEYKTYKSTLLFYVAPHDLIDTIADLYKAFGDRELCVARELTKKFESVTFTTLSEGYSGVVKGEFVLVVSGYVEKNEHLLSLTPQLHVIYYMQQGLTKNDAIKKVAKERGLKKNEVYNQVLNLAQDKNITKLAYANVKSSYTTFDNKVISVGKLKFGELLDYLKAALRICSKLKTTDKVKCGKHVKDNHAIVDLWIKNKHKHEGTIDGATYEVKADDLVRLVEIICDPTITVDVGYLNVLFNENSLKLKINDGDLDVLDEMKANKLYGKINIWKNKLIAKIQSKSKAK